MADCSGGKCKRATLFALGVSAIVGHQDFTHAEVLVRNVNIRDITKLIGPVCISETRVRAAKS